MAQLKRDCACSNVDVRSEGDVSQEWEQQSRSSRSAASLGLGADELSRLVKRRISVGTGELQQLKAWEAEACKSSRGCCGISWNACCLPVLRPSSRAFAWWALLMLLLDLSYTAVICPVSVAFAPRTSLINWAFVVDFVAGFLFSLDVVFNFHVGYVVQNGVNRHVVMSRRSIARLYCLRGTFLVDVLSSSAWVAQVVVLLMAWVGSDPMSNVDLAHVLRAARILRILRVLRLLKNLYLSHSSSRKRVLGLKPHTLHVLQLFYVAGVFINFCGSCWYFAAREAGFEGSWVAHWGQFVARYSADGASPLTQGEAEGIPMGQAWLASVYWASTTVLTVGYGDILPWRPLETGVCLAVQLLGICFFGALLSSISTIIQRASKAARQGAALEEKLASVERYMSQQQVPREVRRRVKRYYADVWVAQQDGLDVGAFYAELPHSLRTDLAWSIAGNPLSHLRCFKAIQHNQSAMRALTSRLEPLQLPPGFTLCEEGEEATACWVVQEGQVCLNSLRELDGQEEEEFVEGPALVGEEALLGAALGYPCHLATLRTLTSCKLWRLEGAKFLAALRAQPQAVEAVREVLLHSGPGDNHRLSPVPGSALKAWRTNSRRTGGKDVPQLQVYVDARSRPSSQVDETCTPAPPAGEAAAAAAVAAAAAAEGNRPVLSSVLSAGRSSRPPRDSIGSVASDITV